jgi:hypothetical protein
MEFSVKFIKIVGHLIHHNVTKKGVRLVHGGDHKDPPLLVNINKGVPKQLNLFVGHEAMLHRFSGTELINLVARGCSQLLEPCANGKTFVEG